MAPLERKGQLTKYQVYNLVRMGGALSLDRHVGRDPFQMHRLARRDGLVADKAETGQDIVSDALLMDLQGDVIHLFGDQDDSVIVEEIARHIKEFHTISAAVQDQIKQNAHEVTLHAIADRLHMNVRLDFYPEAKHEKLIMTAAPDDPDVGITRVSL